MSNKKKNGEKNKAINGKTMNGKGMKSDITSKAKLKEFLLNVRDKMTDGTAAPVYALGAINHVLDLPKIYTYLDENNKEIARDIWLRIKQAGFQIKNPLLLFSEDEVEA